MANLKSSKKDIKRSERKRVVNQSVRDRPENARQESPGSDEEGDAAKTAAAVSAAQKQLDKAAQRGIIHKRQAARRKSRLATAASKASKK